MANLVVNDKIKIGNTAMNWESNHTHLDPKDPKIELGWALCQAEYK